MNDDDLKYGPRMSAVMEEVDKIVQRFDRDPLSDNPAAKMLARRKADPPKQPLPPPQKYKPPKARSEKPYRVFKDIEHFKYVPPQPPDPGKVFLALPKAAKLRLMLAFTETFGLKYENPRQAAHSPAFRQFFQHQPEYKNLDDTGPARVK